MEFVQLTESLVHSVGGEKRTFFIGHQNGRYGVVAAACCGTAVWPSFRGSAAPSTVWWRRRGV